MGRTDIPASNRSVDIKKEVRAPPGAVSFGSESTNADCAIRVIRKSKGEQ